MKETEIKEASEKSPLGVVRQIYYNKYYAEGAVARREGKTLRLGIYNEKTKDENQNELFILECELIMDWETVKKIRNLLEFSLKKHEEDMKNPKNQGP